MKSSASERAASLLRELIYCVVRVNASDIFSSVHIEHRLDHSLSRHTQVYK